MRILAYQPAEAVEDHPVLVVEGRALDSDGYLAGRQPSFVDGFDPRDNLAALFVQNQRTKCRHG